MEMQFSSPPDGNFTMNLEPAFSSESFSGRNLQTTLMLSSAAISRSLGVSIAIASGSDGHDGDDEEGARAHAFVCMCVCVTWQDIRSSTKAKNTLIKKHAKQTGGGPASNQVLTEIDQNVLALIGSTVVEGHETVQESNVQFVSNLCHIV
ncbi:hypothetical protein ALC60_11160 [Trachymyrmex zeteki]|uniref:Uncharacterized protein n=1 Tax=Mycetomoellerius zeteki TaxID=64791 RepID=A0A151WPM7_9HYME|nr:hypothetical protein ALC60_11160 [Trachymyrmex zeteki]